MEEFVGKIINDRYEIRKKIGSGGMSRVFLSYDNHLDKNWAIKCIRMDNVVNGLFEAKVLRHLEHRCLPRIVDVGSIDEYVFLVMDYVEGKTLGQMLNENKTFSEEDVVSIALDILDALNYLHQQSPPIIYRDMKPDNVMMTNDGKIKIIDFGIAREKKDGADGDTVALGTWGYAAPEQFGGQGQSDERTDIYCLGATIYHLVTGKNPCEPPYHMYPIRQINKELSEGLESIIIKATKSNPLERYDGCSSMITDLENYQKLDSKISVPSLEKRKVIVSFSLGITFILVSFILFCLDNYSKQNRYNELIKKSDRTIAYADKTNYLLEAISIEPYEDTAYEKMIDIFKEDGVFTENEEIILIELWEKNKESIKSKKIYGELSYEIGRLYWYYYSYGRESMLPEKQSIPWFQEAIDYGEKSDYLPYATAYYLIGSFYRDISSRIIEGDDKGLYLEYFYNLEKLIDLVGNEENDYIKDKSAELVLDSIESYKVFLINDGVTDDRIEQLQEKCLEMKK